ncbi:MAG: GIY-YIG nuclease family protein [Candidatus Methanomethylicia archaeon]
MLESLKNLNGGTYTLIIASPYDRRIKIGCIGLIDFHSGIYTYTGSALKKKFALYNRISRHLSQNKRLWWHIDYLLNTSGIEVKAMCASHSDLRFECIIANDILNTLNGSPVIGFGSSDCKCISHLHFFGNIDYLKVLDMIYNLYLKFNLKPIKIIFNHQ